MIVIMIGAPGSGKTLQCQLLSQSLHFRWLSMSSLLKTSLDPDVIDKIHSGVLLDDKTVMDLFNPEFGDYVKHRYPSSTDEVDLVIDGMPRTEMQASLLIDRLNAVTPKVEVIVIRLVISDQVAMRRLSARGRRDDDIKVVEDRQKTYKDTIDPIVETFVRHGYMVHEVDADVVPSQVASNIMQVLSGFSD